jgi:hypothetical protein
MKDNELLYLSDFNCQSLAGVLLALVSIFAVFSIT